MKSLYQRIIPFIALGIFVFLLIVGFIALSYVLIFGALIGLVLFILRWLKEKLGVNKSKPNHEPIESKGRTIDHDDI